MISISAVMELLYVFIGLWIMSIFANYDEVSQWQRVKQIEHFTGHCFLPQLLSRLYIMD